MPEAIGGVLSGAGAVIGGLKGGTKGGGTQPVPVWDQVPEPVRRAITETILPAAQNRFNEERIPTPMERVLAPSTPFDSPELYKIQQYSDSIGGLFTPVNKGGPKAANPTQPDSAKGSVDQGKLLEALGRMLAANPPALGGANNRLAETLQLTLPRIDDITGVPGSTPKAYSALGQWLLDGGKGDPQDALIKALGL